MKKGNKKKYKSKKTKKIIKKKKLFDLCRDEISMIISFIDFCNWGPIRRVCKEFSKFLKEFTQFSKFFMVISEDTFKLSLKKNLNSMEDVLQNMMDEMCGIYRFGGLNEKALTFFDKLNTENTNHVFLPTGVAVSRKNIECLRGKFPKISKLTAHLKGYKDFFYEIDDFTGCKDNCRGCEENRLNNKNKMGLSDLKKVFEGFNELNIHTIPSFMKDKTGFLGLDVLEYFHKLCNRLGVKSNVKRCYENHGKKKKIVYCSNTRLYGDDIMTKKEFKLGECFKFLGSRTICGKENCKKSVCIHDFTFSQFSTEGENDYYLKTEISCSNNYCSFCDKLFCFNHRSEIVSGCTKCRRRTCKKCYKTSRRRCKFCRGVFCCCTRNFRKIVKCFNCKKKIVNGCCGKKYYVVPCGEVNFFRNGFATTRIERENPYGENSKEIMSCEECFLEL